MALSLGGSKNKSKTKQATTQTTSGTQTSTLTDQSRQLLMDRLSEIQGQQYEGFDPADIAQYQNPYQQEVIDATTADIAAARGEEANIQRQAMLARGALGSSDRRGVREAELAGRYDRTLATTIGGLRQGGFDRATGVAQTESANRNNFQGSIQAQINQLLALIAGDRTVTTNGTASGTSTGSESGGRFGFEFSK